MWTRPVFARDVPWCVSLSRLWGRMGSQTSHLADKLSPQAQAHEGAYPPLLMTSPSPYAWACKPNRAVCHREPPDGSDHGRQLLQMELSPVPPASTSRGQIWHPDGLDGDDQCKNHAQNVLTARGLGSGTQSRGPREEHTSSALSETKQITAQQPQQEEQSERSHDLPAPSSSRKILGLHGQFQALTKDGRTIPDGMTESDPEKIAARMDHRRNLADIRDPPAVRSTPGSHALAGDLQPKRFTLANESQPLTQLSSARDSVCSASSGDEPCAGDDPLTSMTSVECCVSGQTGGGAEGSVATGDSCRCSTMVAKCTTDARAEIKIITRREAKLTADALDTAARLSTCSEETCGRENLKGNEVSISAVCHDLVSKSTSKVPHKDIDTVSSDASVDNEVFSRASRESHSSGVDRQELTSKTSVDDCGSTTSSFFISHESLLFSNDPNCTQCDRSHASTDSSAVRWILSEGVESLECDTAQSDSYVVLGSIKHESIESTCGRNDSSCSCCDVDSSLVNGNGSESQGSEPKSSSWFGGYVPCDNCSYIYDTQLHALNSFRGFDTGEFVVQGENRTEVTRAPDIDPSNREVTRSREVTSPRTDDVKRPDSHMATLDLTQFPRLFGKDPCNAGPHEKAEHNNIDLNRHVVAVGANGVTAHTKRDAVDTNGVAADSKRDTAGTNGVAAGSKRDTAGTNGVAAGSKRNTAGTNGVAADTKRDTVDTDGVAAARDNNVGAGRKPNGASSPAPQNHGTNGQEKALDLRRGQEISSHTVLAHEDQLLTVHDTNTSKKYFQAYLCVAQADILCFGLPFHRTLEGWGFKICLPERDLSAGWLDFDLKSRAVEERCNGKIVVVLSSNYHTSEECRFLTHFAKTLDPDCRLRNIIPVVIDKNISPLPNVLVGLALINYNHDYRNAWLKKRLIDAIST